MKLVKARIIYHRSIEDPGDFDSEPERPPSKNGYDKTLGLQAVHRLNLVERVARLADAIAFSAELAHKRKGCSLNRRILCQTR